MGGSWLTDGQGIAALSGSKVVKDLVADFLLSAVAALVAVNVTDLQHAVQAPDLVIFAISGSAIRTLYRAALRWATSP